MKEFFNIMFGPFKGLSVKEILIVCYATFSFILLCAEPIGWRPFVIYYAVVLANFGWATHLLTKYVHIEDDEEDEENADSED